MNTGESWPVIKKMPFRLNMLQLGPGMNTGESRTNVVSLSIRIELQLGPGMNTGESPVEKFNSLTVTCFNWAPE